MENDTITNFYKQQLALTLQQSITYPLNNPTQPYLTYSTNYHFWNPIVPENIVNNQYMTENTGPSSISGDNSNIREN